MKIAIVMRPIDQDSGFRAYVEGLVEGLLRIDHENSYLLLYRTRKHFGRFASYENAKEILLRAAHKLLWDQVAVPYRAWREGADIIFNPKFSVPLISHCPVAMGLQEPVWWAWPEHYEWLDVRYMRVMFPLYCRKAAHFFPMANWILEENRKYVGLPFSNATVTHPAAQDHLRPIDDPAILEEFRARYRLPHKFILAVTRVDHPGLEGSSSFYLGKNVHTTVRAFMLCRDSIPHDLVIAGRRAREYLLHMGFNNADLERIHFVDFVPFEELAKLYNLADLAVFPPYYEGFGFALLSAMASGCPVIASETGACPEVVADTALLANPYYPSDFAAKILSILNNEELRQEIRKKGLERAASFNWERTARLTLDSLIRTVEKSKSKERSRENMENMSGPNKLCSQVDRNVSNKTFKKSKSSPLIDWKPFH